MDESISYSVAEKDRVNKSMKEVKGLVAKMLREGVITKDMSNYLIPRNPKIGSLKGNPKLHKRDNPLRTIVNGIGTPTEKIAEVAEYELNEFVVTSPSYIRDTSDFISKLQQVAKPIPKDAILFCFDVCKLYPSVPREEGLAACKEGLEKRSSSVIPTDYVMKMIETVLDSNNFSLGNKHYIQTEGIAIGSKLGKNFACSYMRKWDETLMTHPLRPYKRFIDDGIGIWTGSVNELLEFADFANKIHENIKIELRWSRTEIDFLDTTVKIEDGHVYTDLYVKPTDKQVYINYKSCHPPHTKKGLTYSLGLRLRRICEKDEDYKKNRLKLKRQLRRMGYSERQIEQQLAKVDNLKREDLLSKTNPKRSKMSERVPLVVTYSRQLPNIGQVFQKHMKVLHRSERMKLVFKLPPFIAYRRDRNINDVLIHGKTNIIIKQKNDCECKTCQSIWRDPLMDTSGMLKFNPVTGAGCSDKNVIYALICGRCEKTVYVGETERTVKERLQEHQRDFRLKREKPINRHFIGHTESDVRIAVLRKVYQEGKSYRLIVEEDWIEKLGTKTPNGCNIKSNN